MVNGKLSILIMKDDRQVRGLRLSPFWFKLAAAVAFLVFFVAAAGVYASYTFWSRADVKDRELRALEEQRQKDLVELERLRNMERMIKAKGPEEQKNVLASVQDLDKTEEKKPEAGSPLDLNRLFEGVDEKVFEISNLALASINEGGAFRLSFDMAKQDTSKTLTGGIVLPLITSDGRFLPIEANKADLSFQVQRFKKVDAVFSLPPDVARPQAFALKLTIRTDQGGMVFSRTYSLASLLS